jgi:hypothetical protein
VNDVIKAGWRRIWQRKSWLAPSADVFGANNSAHCASHRVNHPFPGSVTGAVFVPRPKPASLYAELPETDKLEESAFVDTVSRNLRRGRALKLIVGDGSLSRSLLDFTRMLSLFAKHR